MTRSGHCPGMGSASKLHNPRVAMVAGVATRETSSTGAPPLVTMDVIYYGLDGTAEVFVWTESGGNLATKWRFGKRDNTA
jgi:hypothetical protein